MVKLRNKMFILIMLATIFTSMLTQQAVLAATTLPAIDMKEKGQLDIYTKTYDNNDDTVPINGYEFKITRVASVSYYKGNVKYTLLNDYKDTNISFEDMTVTDAINAANVFADINTMNDIPGDSGVTNENGKVRFSDLDLGIYVVEQIGKYNMSKRYTDVEPFIVMVPNVNTTQNGWEYKFTAEPKMELDKSYNPPNTTDPYDDPEYEPPTYEEIGNTTRHYNPNVTSPTEPPRPVVPGGSVQTGDNNKTIIYIVIAFVAAILGVASMVIKKKKNN